MTLTGKFPGDTRKIGLAGYLGRLNFKILFILSMARTHFDDMTPAKQSAFKKKLDRKFRPIPALVAKATQARAKLNP